MAKVNREISPGVLETAGLIVKDSTFVSRELGVIAKRNYRAGTILFTVKGPVRSRPSKYSFAVNVDKHIEPQQKNGLPDFGHYMNHSCDPTAFVRVVCKKGQKPFVEVVARKDLKAGEELTFDYASLEYEVTISGKKCKCLASDCRGIIHGFKDLPPDVVERYKREGLIANHLIGIKPSMRNYSSSIATTATSATTRQSHRIGLMPSWRKNRDIIATKKASATIKRTTDSARDPFFKT